MKFVPIADRPEMVEVRDAATIMWLRDHRGQLQVLMLRRNLNSDFVGGAYVFPGGGVDVADAALCQSSALHGRTDEECSVRLGVERDGSAFWVAALRESFEEAGVLAAAGPDGTPLSFADELTAHRFVELRRRVDSGEMTMKDLCAAEGLSLELERVHYFSRWVTPLGAPRRYDTRFFVGLAPEEQEPLHDDHEVIASTWIAPGEALRLHELGEFDLIFPTVRSLEALTRFASASAVVDHAGRIGSIEAVVPVIAESAHGLRIVLPGDQRFDAVSSRRVSD